MIRHCSRRMLLSTGLRLGTAALATGSLAGLAGCDDGQDQGRNTGNAAPAGTAPQNGPAEAAGPRIALVMKTLTNPFFVEMERGARQAETDLNVRLVVRTAAQETSIEQQIAIVDDLIRAGVAAIVIAPGDSIRLIPVLKTARDQGIAVVNIDNRLDLRFSEQFGLTGVPFISIDNEAAAYRSAKHIADQASAPTEAAIIEGIREAGNAEARRRGAVRAFEENPDIALVGSETANWKIDEAYGVAQGLFNRHPEIGLLFCANDMMALGAIRFLQEAGRHRVLVAGFDDLQEARQAIRAGHMAVTINQQAARQGYLGVQYALRALRGETLPAETMIEAIVVDARHLGG